MASARVVVQQQPIDRLRDEGELRAAEQATAKDEVPVFAPALTDDPSDDGPIDLGAVATGYVNTTHPDTGQQVVFVPGDKLPDWARYPHN